MLPVGMLFILVARTSDYRFIIVVTMKNHPMQITGLLWTSINHGK